MYPLQENVEFFATKSDFVQNLLDKMNLVYESHRENLDYDKQIMKERYDSKVSVCTYRLNDLVWRHDESSQGGIVRKLQKRYLGPFIIKSFLDEGFSVQLKSLTNGKTLKNKVHVDLLKLYTSQLTEEEKIHLRTENEEGDENAPSGRQIVTVDAQTETNPIDKLEALKLLEKRGIPSPVPLEPCAVSLPTSALAPQSATVEVKPTASVEVNVSKAISIPSVVSPFLPSVEVSDLKDLPTPQMKISNQNIKQKRCGQFRQVLDERYNKGNLVFLVSKYGNSVSGELFRPQWILAEFCPPDLLQEYRGSGSV